jgi:hypothetical protein
MKSNLFLQKQGIFYEDINQYVLDRENALKYIEILYQEKKIILGGDVLAYDEDGFYYTYDNWFLEKDKLNIEQSYFYTKSYIENYSSSNVVYFNVVVQL